MGFVPEEFTPTPEEYFWATIWPRPHRLWTDRSGESTFYFNLNMTAAAIQAYRSGGESYTAYKWMRAAQAAPLLVPVAAAAGWIATAEEHGAVTPGVASGIGMPLTPELYSGGTSSNPAGWNIQQWWDRLW